MQDNSDFQDKIMLRNKVFEYFTTIDNVIDFYSGQCVISNKLWSNISKTVTCIDKKQQTGEINGNITRIVGDNNNYINLSSNVIDCDAYGLVMPFIKKIIKNNDDHKVIFFTDGTPSRQRKFKNAEKEFKEHIESIKKLEYDFFLNSRETAYYGYILI